MCGIFGITNKTLNLKQIDASGAALLCHRGPDNEGSWQNDHVKLEHSRLAIIDLSDSANQPFEIVKGKVLVFNGEIYNFQKLREIWSNDEIPWKTNSDTQFTFHIPIYKLWEK